MMPSPPGYRVLRILHFNDVYNIQASKPRTGLPDEVIGGAARFARLLDSFREGGARFEEANPCVLFSGDAFNPSTMSTITKGKQMVPVLNAMGIAASVYGNHDFDFGLDELIKLKTQCTFPWMMSNVLDATTRKQLAEGDPWLLVEHEGIKIGLMGLVEEEWIATLATLEPSDVIFEDPVTCADRLGPMLRAEGAEVVIALTHMREPRDRRLAQLCGGRSIDLVLGGHDHEYIVDEVEAVGTAGPHKTWVIKSGTDFRDLSLIEVTLDPANRVEVHPPQRISVTAEMPEDPGVESTVSKFEAKITAALDKPIGETAVALDCRFGQIRTKETAIGNFVADCIRLGVKPVPDVALINSGTLRADKVIPVGAITLMDLTALLPLLDPLVVISISGVQLLEALENGVSCYPALEGRFPIISGVRFEYDSAKPGGSRVARDTVRIGAEPLVDGTQYTLLTKEYLATGRDGYDVFKGCPCVQDAEQMPMLSSLVRRYFVSHAVINAWSEPTPAVKNLVVRAAERMTLGINSPSKLLRRPSSRDELECHAIAPHVDGRLVMTGSPPHTPEPDS